MRRSSGPGWRLGSPGGVPVYLAPTWPILALVIVFWFGPQVGRAVPGVGAVGAFLVAGVYALLLVLSVLAHEGAHAIAAHLSGARVGRIVVDLFGGHTVYETDRATPGRTAAIAVVGPLANGVLALAGWMLLPVLPAGVPWLLGAAFVLTNGIVGAFNLVPGHPLDGGHILDAAVWRVTGRRHLGLILSGWAGRVVVVAVLAWLVGLPLLQGHPPSFVMLAWTGLVGAMLWSGASQALRAGKRLVAYSAVSVEHVLSEVLVVDGAVPATEVVARTRPAPTGRPPVVLVGDVPGLGPDGAPGPGLFVGDDGVRDGDRAADHCVRLPAGSPVQVDRLPSVEALVEHMHAHSTPLVLLRRGDGRLWAVTSVAVEEALRKAGAST